jgi:hypothetical protein
MTAAAATPAIASSWGRPFPLAAPSSLDVIPADIAFSTAGDAAVAFGAQDADHPASSSAFATVRSPRGRLTGPRRIAGAQQVLGLTFLGRNLELLVGSSRRGQSCCTSVQAVSSAGSGAFGRRRTLVGGLSGATIARVVDLPGGLLAAIASERGVWVSQSSGGNSFPSAHRLTPPAALPQTLDAASLPGGQSIVAWTAQSQVTAPGPASIFISKGSGQRAPGGSHAELTVPAGHWVDELALAPGPASPAVAWIEDWYDTGGLFHSQAMVADLRRTVRPRQLSPTGELASGLAFAADGRGDQALSWKACTSAGDCTMRATLRPAHRGFAPVQQLASVDASQTPAVTVAPNGAALLGWISLGHVLVASARAGAGRFGSPQTVSGTNFAADLALDFGPAGQALAAWTQGTLAQSVIGAIYRSR